MQEQTISVKLTDQKKEKPNPNHLEFGRVFTDHMFIMDYNDESGWHDARIVPYAPLTLDPSAMVLHYGQTVFEGLKAYVTSDGEAQLFRPEKKIERLNRAKDRLCIPQLDEEFALKALKKHVTIEKNELLN